MVPAISVVSVVSVVSAVFIICCPCCTRLAAAYAALLHTTHPELQMFQAWFPCSGDPAATRFPPKPCLASMRQSEPIEASIGQQQPTPTPQSCRMFAKHGFHVSQPQNPRGNSPQQLNTMLRRIEALAGHRSNTQNQVGRKTDKHGF